MDYMKFVDHHRATGADITIGCLPCDEARASDFGLMKVDGDGRIVEFAEKPKGDALRAMRVDTTVLGLGADGAGAHLIARVTRRSWDHLRLAPGLSLYAQVKGAALERV